MQNKTFIFLIYFLSLAVGCLAQTGAANSSSALTAWQGKGEAAVRLIAGSREDNFRGQIWLGVQIKLDPGWKTYWRYPGEAGAAPRFNWENSKNLAVAKVHWPAPRRFNAFGYDVIGYTEEVVIPVLLTPIKKHQPITTHLKLDYMICANICIPMQAKFTLKLIEPDPDSLEANLVQQYRDQVPKDAEDSQLHIISAKVSGKADLQVLRVHGRADLPFIAPDLMVEGPNPFSFGRPKIALNKDRKFVTMELPVFTRTGKIELTNHVLTLTMVDGQRALQQRLKVGR